MVKNQIRTQRNVEEKVSLITCMCPVGCLSVVGKSDWFSYTTSPFSRLLHGDEQDVLCHSGHPGLCLRSRFEKNISYLFKLTRLHGYHSGDSWITSSRWALFAFHGPPPTPALTLLRSAPVLFHVIPSPPLRTPPSWSVPPSMPPPQSRRSLNEIQTGTPHSLWVKRKQLLAVARQRQMWLIPRPRPSSTDTNPLNKQQSVY